MYYPLTSLLYKYSRDEVLKSVGEEYVQLDIESLRLLLLDDMKLWRLLSSSDMNNISDSITRLFNNTNSTQLSSNISNISTIQLCDSTHSCIDNNNNDNNNNNSTQLSSNISNTTKYNYLTIQ